MPTIWYLWWLFFLAVNSYYFTNPPPPAGDTPNTVYTLGSNFDVQWASYNGESNSLDLVMEQADTGQQYDIFRNYSGLWQYPWVLSLASNQSLATTNQFFFVLYITGDSVEAAQSHNFNLTVSASTTSSTVGPTSTSTASSTPSSTSNNTQSSGALTTGAKVGLGVGIPVAVIVGIGAGILFTRRSRKKNVTEPTLPQPYQYQPSYVQVPRAELENTKPSPSEMPANSEPE
ncbi:hypothetical protein UA08_04572 [Talaromyces atroroseus]|uniref:Mid2 domain-containing protein n=1 Tax=Talaromyces atroroseus TaxID=1441469 RepID=A0A225AWK7_TALAT|nr:hypothetical protein UA08_04572 [Talaromyces atroroseus]OKL59999.1 hypothetical protein UA08_04572 [Talaromyces atroroseus]